MRIQGRRRTGSERNADVSYERLRKAQHDDEVPNEQMQFAGTTQSENVEDALVERDEEEAKHLQNNAAVLARLVAPEPEGLTADHSRVLLVIPREDDAKRKQEAPRQHHAYRV